jgi:phosphoglycolate phosphatase-like HAD superfamily hydrolase
MTVLLFDIDGTLVRTNGAGKAAMEGALRESFGVPDIRDVVPYSGRTDPAIGRDLLDVHDRPSSTDQVDRLTSEYLNRLPAALRSLGGVVLPGVRELVATLKQREDAWLGLLTGNVQRGAEIKLGHFDLWHPFRGGGFGDGRTDRDDVARAALAAAKASLGREPSSVWVIGDTPLDVSCARAIGAKVVAVATGWHSLDELRACRPDACLDDLSGVDDILRLWS